MKRKNQEGSEQSRKSGDSAPRYKKENSGTRKRTFSDREETPRHGNSGRNTRTEGPAPAFKKEGPRFGRSSGTFGADKRKSGENPRFSGERGPEKRPDRFSSQKDTPRFTRDRDSGRSFERSRFQKDTPGFAKDRDRSGNDSERFSSRKDAPRFDRDSERSFGKRKFSSQNDGDRSARFRKEENSYPERRKFSEERSSFVPASRRSPQDSERESYRKYDRNPERTDRKPFSSGTDQPGKRKFGKREDAGDFTTDRQKAGSFEYGRGAKPQRRPDYSEENLVRNIPEKQRKKIISSEKKPSDQIRLNRYIANSGICSRREADDLIESGQITVNGKTITEMGYQVKATDVVKYGRKILNPEKLVYVLLNKPKDFITTTEDPEGRRTVMELVAKAGPERIYPVGRLDRATTGLLLFTNDGELAEKLSHPSHEIRKIYQVELDKPLSREDFDRLIEGIELEDGFIKPDEVSVITPDQQVIGIEIHSGKNRVVRRIFEHLGYEVTQLDRTTYAGLTKKDLPRGNWRFLTEKEVIRLKYMI